MGLCPDLKPSQRGKDHPDHIFYLDFIDFMIFIILMIDFHDFAHIDSNDPDHIDFNEFQKHDDHQCTSPVHDECKHCKRILGQGLEGPPYPGCSGSRLCQNAAFTILPISKMR